MITQSLIQEFNHEVTNTRKLLQAVPQKDIHYKPSAISWTMGELAQHIATIYYWYVGTINEDVYDMAADHLERGDPHDITATLDLFERNVEKARAAFAQGNCRAWLPLQSRVPPPGGNDCLPARYRK